MQQYMPVDHIQAWKASYQPLATITTPSDMSVVQKATIKQGVRPVTLAKDGNGKLGVALDAWDKGVFVAFVWQGSSAALGGVRFGDQILQIDGQDVAGWTAKKAMTALRNGSPTGVTLAIRDRPMMRPLTIQKDATNHCGFLFKDGEITSIVKDSSAARNGMLIHHQIIEINAQCVVGLKDKELLQIIQESPPTITITITPRFVYKHLIKKIGFSSLKKYMNHGVPEY
jgi:syntenin-1